MLFRSVECDGDRIIQVLINVLSNAVKFSPKDSEIHIQVETIVSLPENLPGSQRETLVKTEYDNGLVLVTVSDKGSGIPDADKERIFEKFYQAQQRVKIPGQGAGLGLAISRSIMQIHHGALWVEDNPGGGSRFCILLKAEG